jgi:transposase
MENASRAFLNAVRILEALGRGEQFGSLRVVGEWTTRRRRSEKADVENLHRIPSARTIARLVTVGRDTLSKGETITVAAVEAGVPTLVEAREIVAEFHRMIRRRADAELSSWIERARAGLIASFARGVTNDEAPVRAVIILPLSNGQTEGRSPASSSSDGKCTAAARSRVPTRLILAQCLGPSGAAGARGMA